MSQFQIYHNPRCSKSRQTLALLEEHGVEAEVILYLEQSLVESDIEALLKKLGLPARGLLRKGEVEYKAEGLSDQSLPDSALVAAMAAHPKLIERPIVVKGSKAVLGRPPENVLELIR